MTNEMTTKDPSEEFPSLALEGDNDVEVQSVLGHGGMGIVYKGFQHSFNRYVAVKTLHKRHFATPQHLQRFRREARTTAALDHPNVVKTFTLGMTSTDAPFILMEFVEGRTLADVISSQGCLTAEQLGDYFGQILDGLQYAHDRGIVHRDLKPANIMVTTGGTVKIMDFGIAKGMTTDGRTTQSVTATGEVLGSPMYMSPDQCRSEEPNQRSDIYAVGCILFEALEGHPPFTSDAPLELLIKHLNDPPPPMNNAGPKMQTLIHSTLAKNAAERPESCGELKVKLMPLINEPRRNSQVRIPGVKLSKRQNVVVMGLIAMGIVVGGAFLPQNKTNEEKSSNLQGTARRTPESQVKERQFGGKLPQGFDALILGGKNARIRMNDLRTRGTPEEGLQAEFDESMRHPFSGLPALPGLCLRETRKKGKSQRSVVQAQIHCRQRA